MYPSPHQPPSAASLMRLVRRGFLLALLVMLIANAGCAPTPAESDAATAALSDQIHLAVEKTVTHTVRSIQDLVLTTYAFRQARGHWPANLPELREFAIQASMNVDAVATADFKPQADGGLILDGTVKPLDSAAYPAAPSKFVITMPANLDQIQVAQLADYFRCLKKQLR